MVFKRLFMPMLVLGIMFGLSSMAYAQVTCNLSAPLGATGGATATGHTEPIAAGTTGITDPDGIGPLPGDAGGGTLRVTCIAPAGPATVTGVGVMTINLGVPITNSFSTSGTTGHPPGFGIRVKDGTGNFIAVLPYAGTNNVGTSSISNSGGSIVIGLGTPGAFSSATAPVNPTLGITFTGGSTSSFDLEGILVGLNGSGKANVDAIMTISAGANYLVGTNSARVIDAVVPGLLAPTVPTGALPAAAVTGGVTAGGPAILNSAGVPLKGNFTLRIEEGYASMFKESANFNGGAVFPVSPGSDTQVNIVFSDVPSGINISGCAVAITDSAGTTASGGTPTLSSTTVTNTAPILTVNFNSSVDPGAIDVLWVTCSTVAAGTATIPLPTTNVTAKITLAPTGSALSSTSTVQTGLTTGMIPRFQEALLPAVGLPVVIFPPASTVLLIPFAATGTTYNTGIAISNSTAGNPIGTGLQEGTITFVMYENDGTSKTYTTTTGSPGSGLTGAGIVRAGGTYAVNLSELLSAAGSDASFLGYIYVNTNFTHAHGGATIYVTATGAATLSTPVLSFGVSGGGLGQ